MAACDALESEESDLLLVDLSLSELGTAAVLRTLRARTSAAIVLIDSGGYADLSVLLAAGADDFLSKPFSPAQLRARVCVALAERNRRRAEVIGAGGLRLDARRRQVWLDGRLLRLSRLEFDLLFCLAKRVGEVVSRGELAMVVWPESKSNVNHTLDVHLSGLRRKLGDNAARPHYVHTVRGVGFRFAPAVDSTPDSAAFA